MIDTVLLAVIATLLSLVGTLGLLAYKDIARRIVSIEEGYAKTKAALITIAFIMLAKENNSEEIISKLLNSLMAGG